MIIEILFKEYMIYGEAAGVDYLRRLFPDAEFILTNTPDHPYFAEHDVDLMILGPMADDHADLVCDKLRPFTDRLRERIDAGMVFIAMNNALDILGKSLTVNGVPDGHTLGLFDYAASRDYRHKRSGFMLCRMDDQLILTNHLGVSSYRYDGHEACSFYTVQSPYGGFNADTTLGGFRYRNAFLFEGCGTFCFMNPYLVKRLKKHFTGSDEIPFEAEITALHRSVIEQLKLMPSYKTYLQ